MKVWSSVAANRARKGALTSAKKPAAVDSPKPRVDRSLVFTALRFGLYFAAISAFVLAVLPHSFIEGLQLVTTDGAAALMQLAGLPIAREGILIHLPQATLEVDMACTAAVVVCLYSSLILAHPATAAKRVIGIAVGSMFILAANQVRLLATGLALVYTPSAFALLHDYLYQVAMGAVALIAWALWLRWSSGEKAAMPCPR